MGTPNIGTPPTRDEMKQKLEHHINSKYSYGPIKYKDSVGDLLIYKSDSIPVQIELEPVNGTWGEEFDAIKYKVYEIPPEENSYSSEGKCYFDLKFNPSISWDENISKMIMSISGNINGALYRGDIEK